MGMFGLMANCFRCLDKRRQPPRNITLVLVGLDNSGKTTTIKGVQGESIEDVAPTVGFSSVNFKMERCNVTVYDLGGGKKIRDIWKNYYAEVYGVVFVIDASDETRLEECRDVLQKVLRQERVMGKRILVLANKQDQEGALDEIDVCDQLNLEDMVNECKCPCKVQSCSAVQGIGKKMDKSIKEGMLWLLQGIDSDWETLHDRVQREKAEQIEAEEQSKKERRERVKKIREEREKKEAEEKKRLGITDEDEDEEVMMANPFQKMDDKYFEEKKKKEQQLKKQKKSKKSKTLSDSQEHLADTDTVASNSSNNVQTAPSLESQQDHVGNTEGSGDRLSAEEGEVRSNGTALQSLSSRQVEGAEENTEDGTLAGEKKKKRKKKKFKKNNKLAPMPLDDMGETNLGPGPVPSWANPSMPLQRPLLKPSHQPTLEPLMEGSTPRLSPRPAPRLQPLQSLQPLGEINHRGGLPPLSGSADIFGPRRNKPNSELDDDEVVT